MPKPAPEPAWQLDDFNAPHSFKFYYCNTQLRITEFIRPNRATFWLPWHRISCSECVFNDKLSVQYKHADST